jgi:hypothetical protein
MELRQQLPGVNLPNERERRMAYLLFHCGLKPLDIVATYPQEFNDVRAIARLRLSIIELICDRYEGHFLADKASSS